MVRHDFLDRDASRRMIYNLAFSQGTRETITLPAPFLFDLHVGRYTIMPLDMYAYWDLAQPQVSVPEPPVEYHTPVYQWELIRLKRIYNFCWFHAVILSSLVVLCTFYIFFWD